MAALPRVEVPLYRADFRLFPGEDAFPVENDGGKLALKEMAIMF